MATDLTEILSGLKSILEFTYGEGELHTIDLAIHEQWCELSGNFQFRQPCPFSSGINYKFKVTARMEDSETSVFTPGKLNGCCKIDECRKYDGYEYVTCSFVNNQVHGTYSHRYGNPLTHSISTTGSFENGLPHGEFIDKDVSNYTRKYTYVQGKMEGPYIGDYSTGQPDIRATYRDGLLEGEYFEYYRNGKLRKHVTNYVAGKENRIVSIFRKSGELKEEVEYVDGVKRLHGWQSKQ